MAEKRQIRKEYLKMRRDMPQEERIRRTQCIKSRLTAHPWFHEAGCILCYVDFDGEAGTRAIMEEAWKRGKKTAVPKVSASEMKFYEITSFDDLKPGTFGVMEPLRGTGKELDEGLVIMPGAVFDRKRHRIGYGKGYYDRYLSGHPYLRTIAIAFDMQIAETIPYEEHDVRPSCIITETEIIE